MSEREAGAVTVDSALANLKEMMAKDGYILRWTEDTPETLTVHIEAGPEACADCLAPQNVIETIMSQALEATPYSLKTVKMPTAGH